MSNLQQNEVFRSVSFKQLSVSPGLAFLLHRLHISCEVTSILVNHWWEKGKYHFGKCCTLVFLVIISGGLGYGKYGFLNDASQRGATEQKIKSYLSVVKTGFIWLIWAPVAPCGVQGASIVRKYCCTLI